MAKRFDIHIENVLGTSLELRLVASGSATRVAERVMLDEIDRLAAILSSYDPASEFARWQRTMESDVPVSRELIELLAAADAWRLKTHGAFNVGAQAIVERLTAGEDVADAVSRIRTPLWSIDPVRCVARRHTDLPISLDAIAKGLIVSRTAAAIAAISGVSDVLLNIGGDIQHIGATPQLIGIANPLQDAENAAPSSKVRIHNEAIATSGGYRRGFVANGVHYSHIIDPRTGRPASSIVSASVIAPDCAAADALSTAFSVLSPDVSVSIANEIGGISCFVLSSNGTPTTNSLWKNHESITL